MPTLSRCIPTSGHGTRIPVRVEDVATGHAVALVTAGRDGAYAVDVPAGRYRVAERWGRVFEVDVPGSGSFDLNTLTGDGAVLAATPARTAPVVTDMARTLARHKASKQRREG